MEAITDRHYIKIYLARTHNLCVCDVGLFRLVGCACVLVCVRNMADTSVRHVAHVAPVSAPPNSTQFGTTHLV